MRLNAFLAKAGVASRRTSDELIKAGRVRVNGRAGQLNDDVSDRDKVLVDGRVVKLRKSRYILINKPAGYLTTLYDPHGRPKIIDLVKTRERLVPVGRLDYNTTGALLLTNDGDLANRLMHPAFKRAKTYEAAVTGEITALALKRLQGGIKLADGQTAPAQARKIAEAKIELVIYEGRKHQVKRMLASVGLVVTKLHRSNYAGLDLAGLKPGGWRDLTAAELKLLK